MLRVRAECGRSSSSMSSSKSPLSASSSCSRHSACLPTAARASDSSTPTTVSSPSNCMKACMHSRPQPMPRSNRQRARPASRWSLSSMRLTPAGRTSPKSRDEQLLAAACRDSRAAARGIERLSRAARHTRVQGLSEADSAALAAVRVLTAISSSASELVEGDRKPSYSRCRCELIDSMSAPSTEQADTAAGHKGSKPACESRKGGRQEGGEQSTAADATSTQWHSSSSSRSLTDLSLPFPLPSSSRVASWSTSAVQSE